MVAFVHKSSMVRNFSKDAVERMIVHSYFLPKIVIIELKKNSSTTAGPLRFGSNGQDTADDEDRVVS